jgi:hypothetical protein
MSSFLRHKIITPKLTLHQQLNLCENGLHDSDYEECYILSCYVVLSDRCIPTFRNNVLLPFSWSRCEANSKQTHAACLAHSLTLMMEIIHSLKKLVNGYHAVLCDMSERGTLQISIYSNYETGEYRFFLPFISSGFQTKFHRSFNRTRLNKSNDSMILLETSGKYCLLCTLISFKNVVLRKSKSTADVNVFGIICYLDASG